MKGKPDELEDPKHLQRDVYGSYENRAARNNRLAFQLMGAKANKRPVTLPTKPFDHKEGEV